ncbi:hypothetical protein JHW43_000472 [Diplocarpon mali]|nr:hypothetical protein JHW43_000472 [Diplocarpon mali]
MWGGLEVEVPREISPPRGHGCSRSLLFDSRLQDTQLHGSVSKDIGGYGRPTINPAAVDSLGVDNPLVWGTCACSWTWHVYLRHIRFWQGSAFQLVKDWYLTLEESKSSLGLGLSFCQIEPKSQPQTQCQKPISGGTRAAKILGAASLHGGSYDFDKTKQASGVQRSGDEFSRPSPGASGSRPGLISSGYSWRYSDDRI